MQNLTNNPADQNSQVDLSSGLDDLDRSLKALWNQFDPAEQARAVDIGAEPFFTPIMAAGIKASINANAMSPATVLSEITNLSATRKLFIDKLLETENGINFFVKDADGLSAGEADIGFELPRSLFGNDFGDFIRELRAINRIIRVFSEIETGSVSEIKLGPISSTDPLVFLEAPPSVVLAIGLAVSWVLREWKKLEEIRKLRAETAKLSQFTSAELEEFFDNKVKQKLDEAVQTQTAEMMARSALDAPRKAELDFELSWALQGLFARVERGMRVEVRVEALPDATEAETENKHTQEMRAILDEVQKMGRDLSFPRIQADPILALPKDGN